MRRTVLLSTSIGIAVLLACVVALLAALASSPAASAISAEHGASFAVRCDFSHRAQVDPIVSPGGTSAHMHDFFGNKTTNADSTYDRMTATRVTTTCSRPEDTAGYWIPTVSWMDSQGTHELTANRAVFYYRAGDKDYRTVQPFAKDLRIIADKGVNGARVRWYCGSGGSNDEKSGSPDPPTQCSGGVLGLRIIFPDCVAKGDLNDPNLSPVSSTSNYRADDKITDPDPNTGQVKVIDPDTGQVVDIFDDDPNTPDHRLNMARSKAQGDGTRACSDPSYPIPVPTLTINANFPMPTTSGTVTLSSGDASTIHTDFWNTWNQDAPLNLSPPDGRSYGGLNALVKHCINEVPPTSPRPTECRAPTATA
jgi:hypothetical protein